MSNGVIAEAYWVRPLDEQLRLLQSDRNGLSESLSRARYKARKTSHPARKQYRRLRLFLAQLKSPITILLLGAAALSVLAHDHADALMVLGIVMAGAFLSFWQENGAAGAMERLLALVSTKCVILREGRRVELPSDRVVPGDVIELTAGSTIPGDGLLIESRDLLVDEASLTGESFPVEKIPGVLPADTPLSQRNNTVFAGTHVVSGVGKALVVHVGNVTEFGRISRQLQRQPPETEFERGIRHLGNLLLEATTALLLVIFTVNVLCKRDVLESLMFALALAIGLTPQLLPAIISVNLAQGARRMAALKVIVRRLSSIENFGSMNVLCSDKTGTLTTGIVNVHSALDPLGRLCDATLRAATINAALQTGFRNPIDEAIRKRLSFDPSAYRKIGESPYDFIRKRLSVLVEFGGEYQLITKGAVDNVLSVCSRVRLRDGTCVELAVHEAEISRVYRELSEQGFRTLALAKRHYEKRVPQYGQAVELECDMVFVGFLVLEDPPKDGIVEAISRIDSLGSA
ncbi:cation-translocating P-type ATPase [Lacipirellula parvula]|uniref:Mg transport ATPase n=1 Tax=Lacipirellula parvula TaxID=2650471 RepID=A0A5K7XIY9_9BACT|nr:HAD-IC family P-type ATPase [Lacipirellula parvula]BBO34326.1 mg transport ATPase [Lacipirellula parvula]